LSQPDGVSQRDRTNPGLRGKARLGAATAVAITGLAALTARTAAQACAVPKVAQKKNPQDTLSVYRVWAAGGAVTGTGAPKPLNVQSLSVVNPPFRATVVISRRRTRPCLSTYTVPLTDHDGLRCEVKVYRIPVQPGPETGPESRTVVVEPSTARSSSGLTGQSVAKP
jgi:hypothetical protein